MKFALLSATCTAQDLFLSKNSLSSADLLRASTKTQPGRLAGRSSEEIAQKLNDHIQSLGGSGKSCDDHSLDELNQIVRDMYGSFSSELQDVYVQNSDRRTMRFTTLAEFEQSWQNEVDDQATRHAKCFEIGEMWSHHLPEASKASHVSAVPALPVFNETLKENKLYSQASSCQTGHAMQVGGSGSTHQWPDWPEELHYKAKAHGAYPFWWGGGSDSGNSDMEVWWSEKQGAEKFYHSQCTGKSAGKGKTLKSKAGKGKGLGSEAVAENEATSETESSWLNGPCVHLMFASGVSDYKAYLYKADESKCCISQPTYGEKLAPSQGTFWNTFKYEGEVDFNGVYYQGKAKHYVLSGVNEPVRDFWYFTDLDGKPVQQGEAGTGPTDQGYPTSIGHTIWHDYDQSTFDTSSIDPSIFEVPAACKTTSLTCQFP